MANTRKRPARLGKGLSSLMTPVQVAPPAPGSQSSGGSDPDAEEAGAAKGGGTEAETPPPPKAETVQSPASDSAPDRAAHTSEGEGVVYLTLDAIVPNPDQPRQDFDPAALRGLAASIRAEGIMQPIIVRPGPRKLAPGPSASSSAQAGEQGGYELVAGERRWRAAALAELTHIPALVRELDDGQLAQWALIENLQREDLNPMERAEAFASLAERFNLRHDEVAQKVGLERSTISNLLRLLNLSESVRKLVREGLLSMGQSRALAGLSEASAQQALAQRVIREGLSVRQVEAAVRAAGKPGEGEKKGDAASQVTAGGGKSAYLVDLEKQIAEQMGSRVTIKPARKKGAGTLAIEFYSLDQFDELLGKLGVTAE